MNRPLVLGLIGVIIVGVALGLTYVVDRQSGEEIAAVSKSPERNTVPSSSNTPQPSVVPRPISRKKVETKKPVVSGTGTPRKPTFDVVRVNPQSGEEIAAVSKSPERNTVPSSSNTPQPSVVPGPISRKKVETKKPVVSGTGTLRKPTFDIVRVDPSGNAVIAGRASPNAAVTVRDGQKEVGKAKADARGEWVIIPKQALPKGSSELTLSTKSRDGRAIHSDRNVVIVVPDGAPRNATEGKNNHMPSTLAVLVPRKGKGASIIIQKPGEARQGPSAKILNQQQGKNFGGNQKTRPVSIDVVDYDEAGNVTISGNAADQVPLSIYIDNHHAASGVSDRQGRWRIVPSGTLPEGTHTLRVDRLDNDGRVVGRAETQFAWTKSTTGSPNAPVVFVEPGNSLWRIARRVYGAGIQYSVIFDANREQIRDPNLIYPGQVFFVPHAN